MRTARAHQLGRAQACRRDTDDFRWRAKRENSDEFRSYDFVLNYHELDAPNTRLTRICLARNALQCSTGSNG